MTDARCRGVGGPPVQAYRVPFDGSGPAQRIDVLSGASSVATASSILEDFQKVNFQAGWAIANPQMTPTPGDVTIRAAR